MVMASFANGYNPMRWDCEKNGCYNQKLRPKIELFSDCFPGKINFGDVDGIVEINGKALMLEWKSNGAELGIGQRIMYERLTKTGMITVLVVAGDPQTMKCDSYSIFWHGTQTKVIPGNLEQIKGVIRSWVSRTKHNKST